MKVTREYKTLSLSVLYIGIIFLCEDNSVVSYKKL